MNFKIWLEAEESSAYIYKLCFAIMKRLSGYLKYSDLENRWTSEINKLISANNRVLISEYTKGMIESLENLIMADASKHALSYEVKRIPGVLQYIIQNIPTQLQINEFFRDVMQVMIIEKQDRVDRIYRALYDVADMLDMPPLNDVRSKFNSFKQETENEDFWSIKNSHILDLETLVDNSQDLNSIKANFDHLWNYIPRTLRSRILFFRDDVGDAIRKLE